VARYAPLVPLIAGALLLIVGEFVTAREVVVVTAVPPGGTTTGGDLHLYALGVLGLVMLPMSYGAVVRGARPAAVALLVLSVAALLIVLFIDRPAINHTPGILERTYELADPQPATGFYLQSLGAVLALVGSVAAFALLPKRERWVTPREQARTTS
jgi:hypothetical protein